MHEAFHLIFHECEQGSNNNAQPFVTKGGHLKANTFSSASWQQCKHVFTVSRCVYDFALFISKRIVSPVFFKKVKGFCLHKGRLSYGMWKQERL